VRRPEAAGPALVIINADDFGRNSEINEAVKRSFASGFISSATMMANMDGFEAAAAWVRENHLQGHVGLHLNLTQGTPVTSGIRDAHRFCDSDGNFRSRGRTIWRTSRAEQQAIHAEWSAQLQAMVAAGLRPTHLDSHHHVHTQWPLAGIALEVARANGVRAIRLARNCGGGTPPHVAAYKALVNRRIERAGLAPVRYFAAATHTCHVDHTTSGAVELMVHPALNTDGALVDLPDNGPLEDVTARWRSLGALMSYGGLLADK